MTEKQHSFGNINLVDNGDIYAYNGRAEICLPHFTTFPLKNQHISLRKCYKEREINLSIGYDVLKNNNTENTKKIRDFQHTIAKAVINTHDVQRSDSKGKYIIKNLFEAYNTNPQQLPDSALKNLYKILKADGFKLKNQTDIDNNQEFFNIESDELRDVINDAVSRIRFDDPKTGKDKRRDILIMRIICDYIAGMTDSFAISEYEKLYG